ncbi:MAG TPA: carboxypeptidase M32 [bacterium]|nr:carboxypeptidase M32 [bacterium]
MVDPAATQALQDLKAHLAAIVDIRSSMAVLRWDQETQMPPGGGPTRALQLSTLSRIAHEGFVAAKTQELLTAAEPLLEHLDPGSDEAALLRMTRRDLDRARKLPGEFVAERTRAASESTEIWRKARPANDFLLFRPHLERMVEFARRTAEYLGYAEHPYDALLDVYEPESTARDVAALFDRLRDATLPLVVAIADRGGAANSGILDQEYPRAEQREFALSIITAFGYDTERGRLDTSSHPFSTGISRDDVRITTRYPPRSLGAIFGTFHEAGHAVYSQGTAPALDRTPLADGASNGIHESQSRLWENLVGRSRPFWEYAFPKMQRVFPKQLAGVDADTFYRAVNQVRRSLIRVEADEVTYNLHIMLRFELEQALVAGGLKVRDLPDAWGAKMRAYLGISPPTDADGVMQDIHWSGMGFGYFPSYTIGNVASVQLLDAARGAHPDLSDQIRRGEFRPLLAWLRDHVHAHGRKFFPKDLLLRATGSALTPEPYIRYLWQKFGEIYGLNPRP